MTRLIQYYLVLLLLWPAKALATDDSSIDLDEIQALFYQVIALLGLSLIVYLYINFRNNKKRKIQPDKFMESSDNSSHLTSNLRQIVDLIPYAACIANENQKVVFTNAQYDELSNTAYKSWDKQLQINNTTLNLCSTGEVIATNNNGRTLKINIRPINIQDISFPLYCIIVEDLESIQHPQSDVEKRRNNLKKTISNANFPITIIDNELRIFESNRHFRNILKINSNQLLKQSFVKIFPEDEREAILQFLTTKDESVLERNTFHIVSNEKQLIPVELDIIPFDFAGSKATICFFKDISVRLHMEQEMRKAKRRAEESDRLKSSFLANMSHEVRTPLNSIMGFTELMSDEQLQAHERKEFHNIVKASSNELLNLLNDIMEFSKIESGLIKLNNESINPHDIIQKISEYTTSQLTNNSQLKFVINEPIGLDIIPKLISDKTRIKQVLRHLIDNAIKFTYSGTITLSYQYRLDNSIEFIVADTGIGIPRHKIPNIFHKFRQANDENSRDFGGAGLGLSICKHLANVLGGFLWVSSVENHGSEFHFILPAHNNSTQNYRYNNAIVFYSKTPKEAPIVIEETKSLLLFSFSALLNIPMAHNVSVIILNSRLLDDEMALLMAIPQVQSSTIVLYGKKESEVIYSPISKDINLILNSGNQLKKYLNKSIEMKLSD
ncbi:PAS domain-containing protein [Carboxylicivirga sp. A043]|uniref:sensor histidine kinase n=1 Tax=Carboxylicivirga litoralis TaxID=2816963 RepID=UPI0021CB2374|nr:ATP-binding protein [Carboxylicivirga sp. A043]MCU4156754.1 PAS domain-containing protein [Carboxylicivirga sp. A043]